MMPPFDQQITGLKEKLVQMGSLAERAVSRAMKALSDRDALLAREVKNQDQALDQCEMAIDEMAIDLLVKAPLLNDIRLITIATKVSQNLERVGDESTTIARRTLELSNEPPISGCVDLSPMAEIALQMLKEALDAFVTRDPSRARALIPRDREVDALNKQLHRQLASYMVENPATIGRGLNLMVISKSLERIADHATNIAEQVVYLYEGRDIRHQGKEINPPAAREQPL